MTTYERAVHTIADTLPKCRGEKVLDAADRILRALLEKRISVVTLVASPELWTRFHAHCRCLGEHTAYGYRYYYDLAIQAMIDVDDWPIKIIPTTVAINGQQVMVDVPIAESTRKANNRQMLGAYQVIVDNAKKEGVPLPENTEHKEGT